MGTIKDPKLFSLEFGIEPRELKKRNLLDPILNGDTRLFIDPILLGTSKNPTIKNSGLQQFAQHFGNIIRLLKVSKVEGDLPWRNAAKILTLNELPELCLGYGGNSTRGRSLAKDTRKKVLNTAKEIVDLGVDDPELQPYRASRGRCWPGHYWGYDGRSDCSRASRHHSGSRRPTKHKNESRVH
jgi:hypothetical protein